MPASVHTKEDFKEAAERDVTHGAVVFFHLAQQLRADQRHEINKGEMVRIAEAHVSPETGSEHAAVKIVRMHLGLEA